MEHNNKLNNNLNNSPNTSLPVEVNADEDMSEDLVVTNSKESHGNSNKDKGQEKSNVRDDPNIIENDSGVNKEILETNDLVENGQHNQGNKTEKLNYLDLSIINQPNINNIKRKNKLEKIKEINEIINDMNIDTLGDNKHKSQKNEKHIKILESLENRYIEDLIKDIVSTDVTTKLAYLLDWFPKFRSEFIKSLKLKPDNNPTLNVMSLFSRHKIIKVLGTVENQDSEIFLDTCSSVNLITKTAILKLNITKPALGTISETFLQVFSNSSTNSDIYELTIKIGNHVFTDYFRLVEKDDIFDILIGIDTLKRNRFVINLVDDYLYYVDEDSNNITKLTRLYYDINFYNKNNNNNSGNDNYKTNNQESNGDTVKEHLNVDNDDSSEYYPALLTITEITDDASGKESLYPSDIKDNIITEIIKELPPSIQDKADRVFHQFIEVIALKTDDLKRTKLLPHRITLLPNSDPVKQKAYRVPKFKADALKTEISKLIKSGLIEPSHSPWSSPVVLVPKKNNQFRMCVDYRTINNLTVKDAYALPMIDDILTYVGNHASILSTIDLFSGYHQIPMLPEDKDKTCFTTIYGNYNFVVMPFGLCNAPATFQREMNRIFFNLIGKCVFIYIDDLIIFSDSLEQHITDLESVFNILYDNGLKINIEKCHFFKKDVEILGHRLTVNGLMPQDSKIKVILSWLPPQNIKQLRSFLGAVGYYRKFIANFAQIAQPLYQLTKKDVPFIWNSNCSNSFDTLKLMLASAPILSPPNFDKPFIIRTDASRDGIGGVLLQLDDNNFEKPLSFQSRTLSGSEIHYPITELEGVAAYYCVTKFKSFISGSKFNTTLITDHKPLVYIFNNKEPTSSRHIRWITEFSALKVTVVFEEGKKNVIADALSRLKSKNNSDNDKSNFSKDEINFDKYVIDNKEITGIDKNVNDKSKINYIDSNVVNNTDEHNIDNVDDNKINNINENITVNIDNYGIDNVDNNIIDNLVENNCNNVDTSSITVNVDDNDINHLCIIDKTNNSLEVINLTVGNESKGTQQQEHILDSFIQNFIKKKIINLEGVDYYKHGDRLRKIIYDDTEKLKLLEQAHCIGHEGVYKTYHRLSRDYYWKKMHRDVRLFVKGCLKCQTCKPQLLNKSSENLATPPGLPFTRVSLDLIGPLYTTSKGNKYIIVLVDYMTKWVEASPLAKTESQDVINFLKNVFSRHGVPEVLVTDNGPQFVADRTKAFLDLNDVYVYYVSTYLQNPMVKLKIGTRKLQNT